MSLPPTAAVFDEQGRPAPADHPYARRLDELKSAYQQVGDTSATRLAWLLRFAAENPATWGSAARAAYGDGILVLTGFVVPAFLCGGIVLPRPIPAEDVDQIHRELNEVLRVAVRGSAGEAVPMPVGDARVDLVRATARGAKPAVWGRRYRFTSPRGLLQVARELILAAGDRLVQCEGCQIPFLAIGRVQRFCTPKCGEAHRNARRPERRIRI